MTTTRRKALLILALCGVVLAACGTRVDKEAFYAGLRDTTGPAAGIPGAVAEPGEMSDDVGAPGTNLLVPPGGTDVAARPDDRPGGPSAPRPADGGPPRTGVVPKVSSDVVGDVIKIGLHVPITGAAPIPTDFTSTIEVIESYTNAEAPIHGRRIELVVEDDGYDAQVGLAACRRIAERDPLFVIGHTMPAAQDACAAYFEDQRIPYLMRGAYPEILDDRPLAWFGTVPDDIQGRLLAEYVIHQLGGVGRRSAIVYQNDQVAARDAFSAGIERAGGTIVAREQSVPRQPDYAASVEKLRAAGAEFVLLSMPPVDAIKISTQALQAGYHPVWLGGGTWWGYNMVLESAGPALDGAIVSSPWPSVDSAAAEEFRSVYRRYRPDDDPEDVGLVIWGWMHLARAAMERAGEDLSRQTLVQALQDLEFSAPFWHPVAYAPEDHRGARSVAIFRADGQARRWRQVSGFATTFEP